jgi:hypothetical protein
MQGFKPEQDVIITDIGASEQRSHAMANCLPCITASRGASRGFHVSTTNDRLTVKMMEMAQAVPAGFYNPSQCGVSTTQYGHMLGNSVSVNVFMRFLPKVLKASGILKALPKKDYWENAIKHLRARGLVDDV